MHVLESALTCMPDMVPSPFQGWDGCVVKMAEQKINQIHHYACVEDTKFVEVLQISEILATQSTSHHTTGQPSSSLKHWNELSNGRHHDVASLVWLSELICEVLRLGIRST